MRPCFAFKNSADTTAATLSIYDEIGLWGVQAGEFRAGLAAVKAPVINLEINSPGGDVFAGIAIYNMLKASGKTIAVKVMGVAASAASLIAMAGDTIEMPKNSFMMVHNPITGVYGNAEKLRESADVLDKIGNSIVATYVAKTGMDEAAMKELLSKDTWLTADEALAQGFATVVTDEVKADAAFDMDRADLPANVKAVFVKAQAPAAKTPEQIAAETAAVAEAARLKAEADAAAALAAAADPDLAKEISNAVTSAGLPDYATVFAVACASMDEATARIAHAKQITSICALAKKPESAAAFVKANTPVADVRCALVKAMAEADEHVITTPKSTPPSGSSGVNPSALWNSHNAQRKSNRKD
jgi:ATP-dependent protease ClpP protease subunit